jgi:small-conductance mechanosensitive channel
MNQINLNSLREWILANAYSILISVVSIVIGLMFYQILLKQIEKQRTLGRLNEQNAYTLTKIVKWGTIIVLFSLVFSQFGFTLGLITGLIALVGSTILGFAAINTIGNAISGLIIMSSKPFEVGDRIFYDGEFADIISIDLIFTKMLTLDNVIISVPNQKLLTEEIDNFGRDNVVRRHVTVTPAYEYDPRDVEAALLAAAEKLPEILKEPKPYVWINRFQAYAVEYKLYFFINDIKHLQEIDAAIHNAVFETCRQNNIDIRTPFLLQQIQHKGSSELE